MNRCSWVNLQNKLYVDYHDLEWGKKEYNDHKLFELLVLEIFQAGLSWETILNKRENFRTAFDNFDVDKVSSYKQDKITDLINDEGIIRNKRKIEAIINNAKIFKSIQLEYGSFASYIWSFTNNKVVYSIYLTHNDLSDKITKELKLKGMKFIGTTIIYSYLQAIGIINDHEKDCWCYQKEGGNTSE